MEIRKPQKENKIEESKQKTNPKNKDGHPPLSLTHFSALCDTFFLQQDPVSEHVILLVSTAQSDRLGEVSLRQNLANSVAVEIGSAGPEAANPQNSAALEKSEKPLTEAERNQVFLELQKLGFHPGGKLLIGNVELLRQFLDVKDKRRRKFQSDMTARNFAILNQEFIQRAQAQALVIEGDDDKKAELDGTKVADDLEAFLDKYPGSLVAGPFLKGLATALALKLSSNLDNSVIEWVLFDSLFVIADEAYLRDTAGLLVDTFHCSPSEVSNEDATSLGLVERKFDESEVRRRWRVPISKKAAQLILREIPSLANFAGKAAGEFLVNELRVADPKILQRIMQQQRRQFGDEHQGGGGISGMAWRCCTFL